MPDKHIIHDFIHELQQQVQSEVRTDEYSKTFYSTDASIYQVKPYGVFIPQTVEDVHAAVECANKYKVPILARASGSSLAGQAINEALIIDMTRFLDKVIEVNTEEHWVKVQPGMVLDALNIYLEPMGLQFGPDPASSDRAAMGGIVSNNSTGSHSILYGMTADHILAANVILSDGTITKFQPLSPEELVQHQRKSGLEGKIYHELEHLAQDNADIIRAGTPRHWRRCGGYNLDRFIDGGVTFNYPQDSRFNLAKMISGAEGTLGVLTEIQLNLVPLPKNRALAIVHFDSLFTALASVPTILEVNPSAVELLDNLGLTLCREVPEYARLLKTFIQGQPNCILITEFYGEKASELKSKIAELESHLQKQGAGAIGIVPVIDPQHQRNVWKVRKVGLGLMMSIKGDHKPIPFIEDAAVPVEHLAEYVTKVEQYCNSIGTNVAYYAHASAGCIHIRPLINSKLASEVAKLPAIVDFSIDLLKGYGGSLSSEHGDGRVRSWANEGFFGKDLYHLYQQVKTIFDPDNLLNPGNIVNAPSMDANLRYGEKYNVIPIESLLDFSAEKGFNRAVEMCNGAGICRKRTTGTMCPSFMVTREEEHSTRGRANALRAAMSGRLPETELTGERMYKVMDLCIACKACKSECPSSVDMGKIKVEYLAQYHKANGTPLRTRMFGNIARLSKLNSGVLAPIVNRSLRSDLVRFVLERAMGISSERTLPDFARQPFTAWFKQHQQAKNHQSDKKQIVLFNDTFNTYNDPHIAIAATEVLEALGYEVILPGHGCCGRPMISKGLVTEARAAALDTVQKLAPYAKQGISIIGLEPSCYLSLRDEYLYLLPDNPDAKLVADQVLGFEEFIAQLAENGEFTLELTDNQQRILLHGHCHQKSLVGTEPSKATLSLPCNYSVQEVDSGCCGMAGSFGYEAEHYDISIKMAERQLLPAIRSADDETIIVAAGTSCRHQIMDGTGKRVLHPAEVIRNAIKAMK